MTFATLSAEALQASLDSIVPNTNTTTNNNNNNLRGIAQLYNKKVQTPLEMCWATAAGEDSCVPGVKSNSKPPSGFKFIHGYENSPSFFLSFDWIELIGLTVIFFFCFVSCFLYSYVEYCFKTIILEQDLWLFHTLVEVMHMNRSPGSLFAPHISLRVLKYYLKDQFFAPKPKKI